MYAVICFDQPRSPKLRDENRDRHLAYLNDNVNKIVFAGPLKDDRGADSTGLFLFLMLKLEKRPRHFCTATHSIPEGFTRVLLLDLFGRFFHQVRPLFY